MLLDASLTETCAQFIQWLNAMVTESLKWVGKMAAFIVSKPVILIPLLVFFVAGGSIGLIKRLQRG